MNNYSNAGSKHPPTAGRATSQQSTPCPPRAQMLGLPAEIRRIHEHLGPVCLATRSDGAMGWSQKHTGVLDLAELDVALALGEPSTGLCGIQFTQGKGLDRFLAANPVLHPALRVEHAGSTTLLLRVEGSPPSSRRSADVGWLSTGTFLPVIRRRPMLIATAHLP